MKISQALISVSDKEGIVDFARALHKLGIKILSTGGSAKLLREADVPVTEVSDYTGFAEMLDGRVKTLHPKIYAGILARRDLHEHMDAIESANIPRIDLVIVNLYPFAQTIATPHCSLEEAIENIDIGGPTMVRAAAKNFGTESGGVGIVTDCNDYLPILKELHENSGALSYKTRAALASKAFTHTARYDASISNYLTSLTDKGERQLFPECLQLAFDKIEDLRYGENPHQHAAFYRDTQPLKGSIATAKQLQGKALSYNNIADADAAWECVSSLGVECAACVIVKHANPCGVALDVNTEQAYRKAFATDQDASFGGIIAFNSEVDEATALAVSGQFLEVLIAPRFTKEARQVLSNKHKIRVLELALKDIREEGKNSLFDFKRIGGGMLVQTPDTAHISAKQLTVVTQRTPTPQEFNDLLFAWRVAKYVKSNAIVYCKEGRTIGVGAGQMSRVDSARIAAIKAEKAGLNVLGSVVASDAFFPFRDGLDVLAKAGATAVIQPGGSVRDAEVIAAANEQGIAMVFTGFRHFRH